MQRRRSVGMVRFSDGTRHYHLRNARFLILGSIRREKIDCPASITLRLGPKKDRLVVIEAGLEHSHKFSEVEFKQYFKRHQLEASLGLPIRITNNVSKRFLSRDVALNLYDYSQTKDKGMCDLLHEVDILFRDDPGAKLKLVFQEDVAVLNRIFLTTSHMQDLVQRFPRFLYLDRVVCIDEEFELYSVLCQDANGRGRECAYCVARMWTPDLFLFIVASLVQSVPSIKVNVMCITVGACLQDAESVEAVLPCSRVQVCRTRVLEMLCSKAVELKVPKLDTVRNLLHRMANCESTKDYSKFMFRLKAMCPLNFLQYYLDTWHSKKNMWVECWSLEKKIDCLFDVLMTNHIQKLAGALVPSLTLPAFLRGLLDLQVLTAEMATLDEQRISMLYHSICSHETASLIEEELSLAKNGFYELKKTTDGFSIDGGICSFMVNWDMTSCSCSIFAANMLPCQHIFSARLWTGQPLFDDALLELKSSNNVDGLECSKTASEQI
ncbi:uncharacterized protein ZSWIM9-like isoform X2 [Ambystoma mexicanum]|uniref:uncharacterized protein ZSWIM9-like isoform X2 n=1 Tax=Ambystoma mexicanum TaxID=8296 RepID=UPI0037E7C0FA